VVGGASRTIGGDDERTVAGHEIAAIGKDLSVKVGGTYGVAVGSTSGAGDAVGRLSWSVQGDVTTDATGSVTIKAGKSFSISAGECSLTIDPDGLKLKMKDTVLELTKQDIYATSKAVRVFGDDEITLTRDKKTFFKMDDKVELTADEVKINAVGASVYLDTSAKVDGATVALGMAPPKKTRGARRR
jgi:hypothetical protein